MKAGIPSFDLFQFAGLLLFICGLICTGGCSTPPGGTIEAKQAPIGGLPRHKIVAVEVTTRDADFTSNQVELLANSIVDGLRKVNQFDRVYDSATANEHDADLKLSVLVELVLLYNVKSIESSVKLTDLGDGKTLAAANVNSHSESAFFGGHMTNAIAQLSGQIVDFTIKP